MNNRAQALLRCERHARFELQNRPVRPEDLAGVLAELRPGDDPLFLSGRAPLWMYSALAAHSSPSIRMLAIQEPRLEAWVVIDGPSRPRGTLLELDAARRERAPDDKCPLPRIFAKPDGRSVRLGFSPESENLEPSSLADLEDRIGEAVPDASTPLIYWSGRAPVWLVTAVIRHLSREFPATALGVYDPRRSGIVIARPDRLSAFPLGSLILDDPGDHDQPTRVLGIVGDPNSGKSVFSWKLFYALLEAGVRAFRLDADVQAPTGPWALKSELGHRLRNAEKRDWNDAEDVPALRHDLERLCRSAMQIVLVDLPGGDFSQTPPQRIPPIRRPLFADIPEYLVVQRSDEIARCWRREVSSANPSARVIREVLSRLEDNRDEPGSGQVRPRPLERETLDATDPVIDRLADTLVGERSACQPSG